MHARWMPKVLTNVDKEKRMGAALTFLTHYYQDGDNFLNRIVTEDETWFSSKTPERKRQSWNDIIQTHHHNPEKKNQI